MENKELQEKSYTVLPQVEFGEAVKRFFNKAFQFTGRSRRSEYWWAQLGVALIMAATYLVLFLGILSSGLMLPDISERGVGLVGGIFLLLFMVLFIYLGIAQWALTFRRLHDTGRSGWWVGSLGILYVVMFTVAISLGVTYITNADGMFAVLAIFYLAIIILGITIFVFTLLDSKPGDNRYGKATKYVEKEEN